MKLVIGDFVVKKRSIKVYPDHLSKLMSRFLIANGLMITAEDIITAIEDNVEPLKSVSTKSMSMD